ncbi:hypothetical protein EDD85DRAFT_798719 [Armillaria nabsnona]|nr:hypothetical protein EDD85DRAFT_798719 [Armillaria nabsnona]
MTELFCLGFISLSTRGCASMHLVPPLLAPPLSLQYKLLAVSMTNPTSTEASAAKYSTANMAAKAYHMPESITSHPDLNIITASVETPNHVKNATKDIEAGKDLFIKWPAGKTQCAVSQSGEIGDVLSMSMACRTLLHHTSQIAGPYAPWGPTVFKGGEYLLKKVNGAVFLDIPGGHFLEAFMYILGPVNNISASAVIQLSIDSDWSKLKS